MPIDIDTKTKIDSRPPRASDMLPQAGGVSDPSSAKMNYASHLHNLIQGAYRANEKTNIVRQPYVSPMTGDITLVRVHHHSSSPVRATFNYQRHRSALLTCLTNTNSASRHQDMAAISCTTKFRFSIFIARTRPDPPEGYM